MALGKTPRSNAHLAVLALCVVACLTVALLPGQEVQPREEDAEVLMRAVMTRMLGWGEDAQLPPAN